MSLYIFQIFFWVFLLIQVSKQLNFSAHLQVSTPQPCHMLQSCLYPTFFTQEQGQRKSLALKDNYNILYQPNNWLSWKISIKHKLISVFNGTHTGTGQLSSVSGCS